MKTYDLQERMPPRSTKRNNDLATIAQVDDRAAVITTAAQRFERDTRMQLNVLSDGLQTLTTLQGQLERDQLLLHVAITRLEQVNTDRTWRGRWVRFMAWLRT